MKTPPSDFRLKTTSLADANAMREEIEITDEVAAAVVEHDGIFYVVYAEVAEEYYAHQKR
jgi:hypothetical protein